MVDELILVWVPLYDVLLLEDSLKALYVMRVSLSQGKSLSNCSVNGLQLLLDRWDDLVSSCRLGGSGRVEGSGE